MPLIFAPASNNVFTAFKLPYIIAISRATSKLAFLDKRYFAISFLFFKFAVLNGVLKRYSVLTSKPYISTNFLITSSLFSFIALKKICL
ncbi:hypothetical protein MCI_01945 [Rickettsia montanensis str. OSU 85-930]|uniref:Uncharacterized protein n=1 Tax=Rickettsia montanensis (strain OSU 85-930) TaxID=1105114 RepID=H8KBQ9_RICMS|nr:hypothetical protein [Rickettsia montanensis]AFC73321.1 hypothetical protein MCI_01945 [Rickettsia montanensis str. OSU 85-930]